MSRGIGLPLVAMWLFALLGACGEDSGGSAGEIATPDAVVVSGLQRGVFVDEAVAGLDYATATRVGVTDAEGGFSYMPGETVQFSLGGLRFPPVPATSRMTPVDLGRTSADPERFATNVARLLQTLDLDGDPENGIVLPAVGGAATPIDFDVPPGVFEADPAVTRLVSEGGGIRATLIPAALAAEHLGKTLAEGGAVGSTNDLAGFWRQEPLQDPQAVPGEGERYYDISRDGDLRVLTERYGDNGICHFVLHATVTPLGGERWLLAVPNEGRPYRAHIGIADGRLSIEMQRRESDESIGPFEYADDRIESLSGRTGYRQGGRTSASMKLCHRQSLQRPPSRPHAARPFGGIWVEEGVASPEYLVIGGSGHVERLTERRTFGPPPEHEPFACYGAEVMTADRGSNGTLSVEHVRDSDDEPWLGLERWSLSESGTRLSVDSRFGVDRVATFTRVDAAAIDIVRCEPTEGASPLEQIVGVWRNRGDDYFGRYLRIDPDGTMTDYAPDLAGRSCYAARESQLTELGGFDFRVTDDAGSRETLRVERNDDGLTVADVALDGQALPVRWLEGPPGIETDTFEICPEHISADDIDAFEPLVGLWSRVSTQNVGAGGETFIARRDVEYWRISPLGGVDTLQLDERGGTSCGKGAWRESGQLDAIGSGRLGLNGGPWSWTLTREGARLRAVSDLQSMVFESRDIDLSAIRPCFASSARPEAPEGLWAVEPEESRPPLLVMLTRYTGYFYRHDVARGCGERQGFSVRAADDGKLSLEFDLGDTSGVRRASGRFEVVDGALEVAFDAASGFGPLSSGTYPPVRGIDPHRSGLESCR